MTTEAEKERSALAGAKHKLKLVAMDKKFQLVKGCTCQNIGSRTTIAKTSLEGI